MKKKLLVALGLSGIIAVSVAVGAYAASDIKLSINGKSINADLQIVDGSSYIPLRIVSETLGADVKWDENKREISIVGKVPQLPIDGVYKAGDLAFYDLKVENGKFGWDMAAEVKNIGTKTVEGANFTAVFYDGNGKRIGTASGSTNDLNVSDVKTQRFITSDDLTGYKSIKFQIDISY